MPPAFCFKRACITALSFRDLHTHTHAHTQIHTQMHMQIHRQQAVIRPEMFGMVAQLETAIKEVHDHTFTCQKELQFMIADNRSAQKHAAGLQLVTTGWPNGLTPQQREYMLGWMLGNTPEVVTYLQARGLLAQDYDHTALSPNGFASFWFNVLSTEPVTVPQQGGFVTFKSWDKVRCAPRRSAHFYDR